jgi:hypothetical protein
MAFDIEKLKRAQGKLVGLNEVEAKITRRAMVDNGRGAKIPSDEASEHYIKCRIADIVGGVWREGLYDGGMFINRPKYAVCENNADIESGDILTIDERISYRVGIVSGLRIYGEAYGKQAELFEASK